MSGRARFRHPEARTLWDRLTSSRSSGDARRVWLEAGWWFAGERDELTPREEEEFGRIYAAASARYLRLRRLERFAPRVH